MRTFFIISLLAFGLADLFPDDGDRDGRRGNALYTDEAYEEAAESYAAGLAGLSENASLRLRYGLNNNLGAALLKSGDAAGAREALERALSAADGDVDLARTTYNAGNAAFAADDLQAALDYYRRSLLRNPDNEDAKFNYEFVKRRMEEQQEQPQDQQQQGDSEQSEDQQRQDGRQPGEQDPNEEEQEQPSDQQQDGSDSEPQEGESRDEPPPQNQSGEPSLEKLSSAQAERILQALQNEEEQLLRQVQRPSARPRRVEKDW